MTRKLNFKRDFIGGSDDMIDRDELQKFDSPAWKYRAKEPEGMTNKQKFHTILIMLYGLIAAVIGTWTLIVFWG